MASGRACLQPCPRRGEPPVERLPRNYREKAAAEPLPRVICDYIAGMTDPFIYQQCEKYCGGVGS